MPFKLELRKLAKRLFPTGRAFRIPPNSEYEKLIDALAVSESAAFEFNRSTLDGLLPDNDNFTEAHATLWERRLGMITSAGATLEDRKAAIYRKMRHPGTIKARQHYLYLEGQLQLAGFDVWVYENRFDDGMGGLLTKDPFEILGDETLAVFGVPEFGQTEFGKVGTWGPKIANYLEEEKDEPFVVGPSKRSTFFIAGFGLPTYATVIPERRDEFRELVHRIKPKHSVAYLFVHYTKKYEEFAPYSILPSGYTSNYGIEVIGDRAYILAASPNPKSVYVWDLENNVEIPGESFGSGDLNNAFLMHYADGFFYITTTTGPLLGEVKVYEPDGTPGQDFETGILSGARGIFTYDGKGYVTDNIDDVVYVFNLVDGANIPDETFGSGSLNNPRGIFITRGKIYIVSSQDTSIKVFDLETKELISTIDIIYAGENLEIVNNRIYVATRAGNRITVIDLLTEEILSDEQLGGFVPNPTNTPYDISIRQDYAFVVGNQNWIAVFKQTLS